MKRIYFYEPEAKASMCHILMNGKTIEGFAQCHPDDFPYESELIGLCIAEVRAEVNALREIRDNELIPSIKILTHLQNNMQSSKYYNPKSYEARMLRRQIRIKEAELQAIREEIKTLQEYIRNYIAEKDKLHTQINNGQKT